MKFRKIFIVPVIIMSLVLFSCKGTQTAKQEEVIKNPPTKIDTGGVPLDTISKVEIDSTKEKKSTSVEAPSLKASQVTQNRTYNDVSRMIAGLKQDTGSKIDTFQNQDSWKKYAAYFNANWSTINKKRLKPMNEWGKTELSDINSSGRNIFYPFSGADFMSVFTLFPNAKTYTMLALERPGALPNISKLNEENFAGYLNAVKTSLADIFIRSFFVTRNMQKDLMKQNVNGTLPLLSVFMVRTGCKILNIERVKVNSSGKIQSVSEDSANSVLNRGVKITFTPAKSDEVRTLYYFSLDLVDEAFTKNKGMQTYLKSMEPVNTYIKSASYLLHWGTFSIIRKIILDRSEHVLQDDSGIKYSFYDKKSWNVQLYGSYEKPINQFKHQVQKDLREDYMDSTKVKPIPFITGYHWGTKNPNLQLAIKKGLK